MERILLTGLVGLGASTAANGIENALVNNDVIEHHFSQTVLEGSPFQYTFGIEEPAFVIAAFLFYFFSKRT